MFDISMASLQWRHNWRGGVSNHQLHHCLLNRLFRRRSKKTSKLRVTGPCAGNSPVTGEFLTQMASYAENVSIWWQHHDARQKNTSFSIVMCKFVFVMHQQLANDAIMISALCHVAHISNNSYLFVIYQTSAKMYGFWSSRPGDEYSRQ